MSIGHARRWIWAAGVAGALAFGATQATAAPEAESRALRCDLGECNTRCKAAGYAYGSCATDICRCFR
ncbi:MAG TPA: hypothetical protein VF263_14305 [Longimicrobiaceae bacterium]